MSATVSTPAPPTLREDATVISLVGFAHGASHFFHFMLPPIFPWLMADFGLTFTQAGACMTVFFVVSGFLITGLLLRELPCARISATSSGGMRAAPMPARRSGGEARCRHTIPMRCAWTCESATPTG